MFISASIALPLLPPSSRLCSILTALLPRLTIVIVLANPHRRVRRRRILALRIDDALLDVRCEAVEGLVHVDVALGADLEERDAEFVGEGLALFCGDGALLLPVAFVADEDLVDAF